MQLAGKVGLVTGGASGIGRATVERLVAEGMQVCTVDLDADGAAAVAEEFGGTSFAADVGESSASTRPSPTASRRSAVSTSPS